MKYICKKECFFRKRLWKKGETLEKLGDEKLPEHFVKKGEAGLVKAEVKPEEPKTIKELHEKEVNVPLSKPGEVPVGRPKDDEPEFAQ